MARRRQLRPSELRAAISLSRLWKGERRQEACELLSSIYESFSEGFDYADLKAAKATLESDCG